MPNLPQYTIAYYGALKAGGVVVPTNPLYVPREIEHQVKDSGATYMVVMSLLYNRLRQVRDGLGLKKVIVTNIKEYFPFFTQMLFTWLSENVPDRNDEVHRVDISEEADTIWFQDFLDSADGLPEHVDITPEDTAIFMYTGGTTGVSKGAEFTEGQCTIMTALPLSHAYSMTTSQNTAIRLGGAQVMIPNPRDMKDVLKNLQKHKVDFFPAVPTLYTAINHHPDVQAGKYDLSSIKVCISGGSGLPKEVQDAFMQITGGKLVEGYGLSECSPVGSANPFGSGGKVGTIGIPFPSTEYKIVDIETGQKSLPQGEEGELCIKGPQVMKGYWNMPDETKIALRPDENGDLWLYTGDIAKMDADGYFKIMDRKKDIIIAGGFNIYPNQVEEVLYTHPDIVEAAVVGVPHETRGEVAKAFVVLKEGRSMTEDELRTWCKKEMRAYMVPKYIEFRKTLPKTMVGKVLRRALVEDEQAKT
jgi:long-chain acyl-CoA synthetase